MVRLNTKTQQDFHALALIAALWSSQAATRADSPSTRFVNTADWDFGTYEMTTQ